MEHRTQPSSSSSSLVAISLNADEFDDALNCAAANHLNFSIERILGSEFGTTDSRKRRNHLGYVDSRQIQQWLRDETSLLGVSTRTESKNEDDQRMAETERRRKKKEENENNGRRKTNSSTVVEEGRDRHLPAWIFCTRYSDRPSSGEIELEII